MTPLYLLSAGLIIVIGSILVFRLHPVLALLLAALFVSFCTPAALLQEFAESNNLSPRETEVLLLRSPGERVAIAFGNTAQSIGLLIILASIMGKCLLESGAAERIVRTMVSLFGERKAPIAYTASSFVLGIPIFFDTVFYLMIPLARAMGVRHRNLYAVCVMAIIAGGSMAHSLVPPTPGPLFAAGALNVNIGVMIVMGTVVGVMCSSTGMIYAYWLSKRQDIPLRTTTDTSVADLEAWMQKDTRQLPSFFMSNLPLALPVILIGGEAVVSNVDSNVPPILVQTLNWIGHPVTALFIGTSVALYLFVRQHSYRFREIEKPIEKAISSAGSIILITCMGGAFGAVLQQTSIGNWLVGATSDYKLATLPMAFLVTAVIRTAQGSATVAMVTAVGILTVLNVPGGLGFHPVYLALVIGCGSKIFPWMNDSGFWIICKMSGFTEAETIRNFSVLLTIMGCTGLVVCMLFAKMFPLV